jgi:hypothetical protein
MEENNSKTSNVGDKLKNIGNENNMDLLSRICWHAWK